MSDKKILLSGKNVCKYFGESQDKELVLDHLNMDVYEGDFTVIMGPSGSGKSTLLYALSGMNRISDGTVTYKNQIISAMKEAQMAKLRVEEFGFVFQQTHLVDHLTLFENVVVAGLLDKKRSEREVIKRANGLLAQMHVEKAQMRMPAQTSGGEAQRAAMARAVINRPGILFADEPTGALNKGNTEDVLDLLTVLNKAGQSVLMVTHDMRAAIRGNCIIYLEDGKIMDEMVLPPFDVNEVKSREIKLSEWLTALEW